MGFYVPPVVSNVPCPGSDMPKSFIAEGQNAKWPSGTELAEMRLSGHTIDLRLVESRQSSLRGVQPGGTSKLLPWQ
jgi:hypothetical protein